MGYNCIVFRDMGEWLKANDGLLDETRRLDSKKVDIVVRGCSSLLWSSHVILQSHQILVHTLPPHKVTGSCVVFAQAVRCDENKFCV